MDCSHGILCTCTLYKTGPSEYSAKRQKSVCQVNLVAEHSANRVGWWNSEYST